MKSKAVILLFLLALTVGCSTTSSIPVDDVYYWPGAYQAATASSPSSTSSESSTSSPSSIEYISVQDTTVTIRVKK